MIEPLYGSGLPMWPGPPLAVWPHAPGPIAQAAIGGGQMGFNVPQFAAAPAAGPAGAAAAAPPVGTPEALGFGGGAVSFASPPLAIANPFGGGLHGLVAPESAVGWTHRALLAAVALRRGQPMGPTTDQECEDFVYDALDLLSGTSDVEVKCEANRITLSGSVSQKWLKRDIGEIAWAIPGVNDVQNNVTLSMRRRPRAPSREAETPAAATRKSA